MLWTTGSTSLMLMAHQSECTQGDAGSMWPRSLLCWRLGLSAAGSDLIYR
jgi:hypothetical protein